MLRCGASSAHCGRLTLRARNRCSHTGVSWCAVDVGVCATWVAFRKRRQSVGVRERALQCTAASCRVHRSIARLSGPVAGPIAIRAADWTVEVHLSA